MVKRLLFISFTGGIGFFELLKLSIQIIERKRVEFQFDQHNTRNSVNILLVKDLGI